MNGKPRPVTAEIRRIIGDDLARRFFAVFAGNYFTFPAKPNGASFDALRRIVGPVAAERLCVRYAREQVYIPRDAERAERDAEIAARLALGEPLGSVARAFRLTVRYVRMIERRSREEGDSGGNA